MHEQINFIERDGFTLKYVVRGDSDTTALVIGSHIYYPRTFLTELENKLNLIYMDHRGFSTKSAVTIESDFELDKLLDDIEYLRKQLKLEKIIVIGHSIHALMAVEYAKKYPDSVDKLILIATSPIAGARLFSEANKYFEESVDPIRKKLFFENMQTLQASIEKDPSQAFVTRMLKFAPMIWYEPSFDARHLWKGVAIDAVGGEVIWNKIFVDYEMPDLSHLDLPTLLLLGRYDYWNPPHLWEKHRSKFKNLMMRVFEKSGHTPQLEQAELFNDELLVWLDK